MQIESKVVNNETRELIVTGEVDADNCALVTAKWEAVAASELEVLVNLAGVTFLDSSGVSELLQLKSAVTDSGAAFRISDVSSPVHRVFEITGLLGEFGLA